ncbi:Ras guanine nucleotide exchange factor putative [Entamoeba histolytica]|uniref:Ras guanine nucleotide exchange factor, putative n=4 Tax=Entamoeba histolytica TaxID=5759 RepID=C4LYB7_ENTH1|nr:Ras guanine nucleotide exchange factor, putative [Entamoeba histolytica HM-1:IMSS]EAL49387.1 Ras guanine nucleotide exchange factor, putative [Entamoeba histolytica HM-1:IMSS]GAT93804.1 Ras guanine nucleotide exchange factor putative [Entamoeba histolytica]|eukprot:XP_654773.1 Ras guanine nucleotide exchange factor, putative [Entamoeba histolytica HM-1:IMSS]
MFSSHQPKSIVKQMSPLVTPLHCINNEESTYKFPSPIKDIVFSSSNILYVTETDDLYASGHVFDPTSRGKVSLFSQSFTDSAKPDDIIKIPQKIEGVPKPIDKVSVGSYFCVVLSKGKLYSWGAYEGGQLGIQEVFNPSKPESIPQINDIKDVCCGGYHTLALNIWGEVFSWGKNEFGQLGRINTSKKEIPSQIPTLRGCVVSRIFCGGFCSACITDQGMGYIWGKHLKMKELKRIPTQLNFKGSSTSFSFIISIELACNDIFIVLHDGRLYRFIDFDQFEEQPILSILGVTRIIGEDDRAIVECDNENVYEVLLKDDASSVNMLMKSDELGQNSNIHSIITYGPTILILYEQNPQYMSAKKIVFCMKKFLRQLEGIINIYLDPFANFVQLLDSKPISKTPHIGLRKTQSRLSVLIAQPQQSISITNPKEDENFIVSPEDIQKIFYGIKPLAYSLPIILNGFLKKLNQWTSESSLYDVICSFLSLNITRQFINISNNLAESLTTLQMIKKKSSDVQQFLKKQEQFFNQFEFDVIFDKKNDLPSLLLLPIKFLPQFYSLIKEYHKCLPSNHPDFIHIKQLFKQMDKLLSRINDSFHLDNIFDIVKCFPDENGSVSIISGTETELINRLYNMNLNDPEYVDMFLMLHKKFISTETVIFQLVNVFNDANTTEETKSSILSVFIQWTKSFFSDFEKKPELIKKIKTIISSQPESKKNHLLILSINSVGISLAMRTRTRVYLPIQSTITLSYQYFMTEPNTIALAETLNSFNLVLFSRVTYEELIVMNYNKQENKPLTPNIQNMIERFNWIGSTIVNCFNECPKGDKAQFIQGLILFMKRLQQLKDIHFLVSVVYTLPRLDLDSIKSKKISEEDKNYLNETEELCSFKQNYKYLRAYLSQLETPYIPFIGILSKDLMLIDEGNPDKLGDGTINLYKWRKVYELTQQFLDARPTNPCISSSNEQLQILIQKIYSFK